MSYPDKRADNPASKATNKLMQHSTIKAIEYLSATLAQDVYWIDYLKLNNIVRQISPTPTRQATEFTKGVIDPRGRIIPFFDK